MAFQREQRASLVGLMLDLIYVNANLSVEDGVSSSACSLGERQ
jgi:hypothetical protein